MTGRQASMRANKIIEAAYAGKLDPRIAEAAVSKLEPYFDSVSIMHKSLDFSHALPDLILAWESKQ